LLVLPPVGVIVYDFNGPDMQPQLLLVREKTGCWNLPAGVPSRWVQLLLLRFSPLEQAHALPAYMNG
jgi:hypothetical protein